MKRVGARLIRMIRGDSGASGVEFTLIVLALLMVTSAVIEAGVAAWQWNAMNEATHLGVRVAVVADPVASGLTAFDCKTTNISIGTPCTDPSAQTFDPITCSGAGSGQCVCASGSQNCVAGAFDSTAYQIIRNAIVVSYPFIQDSNIVINYSDSRLGFAGRPTGPIPLVTVRLTGVNYDFLVLDVISRLLPGAGVPSQITMPDVAASLTGEDLALKP